MDLPVQLTITDQTQKSWSFNSIEAFELFIQTQAVFWIQKQGIASQSAIANSYISKGTGFQAILNTTEAWKSNIETWDLNTFNSNFTSLINNNIGTSWLWSSHPFVNKWEELIQISVNTADAFFEAMVQKTTSRLHSGIDYFQGYLIAYEYINQGETEINKRRKSEAKSLSNLRDQLANKNDEIISKTDKFQKDVITWKDNTASEYSKWYVDQQKLLADSVLSHSNTFHSQLSNWIEKHSALDKQFREEMRLRPAAQYWADSAKKLSTQGRSWANALVLAVLLGFITFAIFFIFWLKGEKTTLNLQSFEGVLIFATIVSSYAFLLKSISKAMFSAFHLQRVSEESELLTNLYLSLNEGKNDDSESRKIVLQALFSRSETGLLTGEHGPTMPSATEFINVMSKAKN